MRRGTSVVVAVLGLMLAVRRADADFTIAVFAPAAPLANTQARVDLGKRLADHFRALLPTLVVKSRVFARAGDFEKAVDTKGIGVALVDATYLVNAQRHGHRVIAASPPLRWQLVAGADRTMASLAKQGLLLATGGHGHELSIADGLLQGEARFFGTVAAAQDSSASALAALALGRTACVLAPSGLELPDGVAVVKALGELPGLVLVIYPAVVGEALGAQLADAASSYRGPPPVSSLSAMGDEVLVTIAERLAVAPRRGPMLGLPLSGLINLLPASPPPAIEKSSALDLVVPMVAPTAAPPSLAPPSPATSATPAAAAPRPLR